MLTNSLWNDYWLLDEVALKLSPLMKANHHHTVPLRPNNNNTHIIIEKFKKITQYCYQEWIFLRWWLHWVVHPIHHYTHPATRASWHIPIIYDERYQATFTTTERFSNATCRGITSSRLIMFASTRLNEYKTCTWTLSLQRGLDAVANNAQVPTTDSNRIQIDVNLLPISRALVTTHLDAILLLP